MTWCFTLSHPVRLYKGEAKESISPAPVSGTEMGPRRLGRQYSPIKKKKKKGSTHTKKCQCRHHLEDKRD